MGECAYSASEVSLALCDVMERGLTCKECVAGRESESPAERSRVSPSSSKSRWFPLSKHCFRQNFSNRAIFCLTQPLLRELLGPA